MKKTESTGTAGITNSALIDLPKNLPETSNHTKHHPIQKIWSLCQNEVLLLLLFTNLIFVSNKINYPMIYSHDKTEELL